MKKSRDRGSGGAPKPARRVPDLYVEQLLLDELPEQRKRRLAADPEVHRRLGELEASNREIAARYPAAEMVRRIEERAQALKAQEARERAQREAANRPRSLLRLAPVFRVALPATGLAALVIVAGLLVVTLYPGLRGSLSSAAAQMEQTRLKGGAAHLVLYRQTTGGAERLRDNDRSRRGDVLQIGYVGDGSRYGVIVSLDGRGTVTVHYPAGAATAGASAASLEPKGETLLSFAYELDDAPGFERFFLVSSERPFSVETVVAAARELAGAAGAAARTARLSLPGSLKQTGLTLRKE